MSRVYPSGPLRESVARLSEKAKCFSLSYLTNDLGERQANTSFGYVIMQR